MGPQSSPPPILKAQKSRQTADGEPLPARRDAATLTETVWTGESVTGGGVSGQDRRGRRCWELHRAKELLERREKRTGGHRSRGVEYSSEEEPDTEEEEVIPRGRRDTNSPEPEHTEQRVWQHRADRETGETELPVIHRQDNRDWIRPSGPTMTLQATDIKRTAGRPRSASNRDKAEFATGLMIGAVEETASSQLRKDRYRQELQEQMAEQQRNRKKEKELELRVAATGAVDPEKQPDRIKQFGAVNREYETWRRDVPYRPGKGVDALEVTPRPRPREGKPPEGTVTKDQPEKPLVALPPPWLDHGASLGALTGRTGLGIGAGVGVPGLSSFNEDFHRSLSNTLGEMAAPRLASLPPPVPPTVSDTYKTPYDEAYYFYGTRNPLDLQLPYYPVHLGGQQQHVVFPSLSQGPLPGPAGRHGGTNQRAAPALDIGALPGEKPRSTREGALRYQEELRQQIKEREDRRRREKEEQERYDAKMEAEMKAHDPWGRSGGGAPIKDRGGNLISDLKQMHRTNREAYMNPESRDRREAEGSVATNLPMSQGHAALSRFGPGYMFSDQPTPQQLREQDSYREFLKRQIEEKRQKELEEQERIRREEEREERRLLEQRAHMQQEYEREHEKGNRRHIEQSTSNKGLTHKLQMHRANKEASMNPDFRGHTKSPQLDHGKGFPDQPSPQQLRKQNSYREFLKQQIEEKRQKGVEERERIGKEEEREERRLAEQRARIQQEYEREHGDSMKENNRREPSPLVPTLQKRLDQISRPSTVVSQRSSRSVSAQERSLSAPHSPPVPARRNQLRAREAQRGVIRELSALRRHLRSEQRRLAGQLGQADKAGADTPVLARRRPRPKADAWDVAWLGAAQAAARRPHPGAPRVNMQNIREFTQLKHRDTASREEVLQMYPDPPSDEHSLDIQQQALLREQERGARSRRRRDEEDRHDQQLNYTRPRAAQAHREQGGSLLASESAFIDCCDPGRSPELADKRRSPQTSSMGRERRGPLRIREHRDEEVGLAGQRDYEGHPDAQSLGSLASLNVEQVMARNLHRIRRLDQLSDERHDRSGGRSGDDEDISSLLSTPDAPRRRVSVETVATEPWLRPGTSEGARRQSWRETPGVQDTAETEWEGPSTNHG